jgi:protein O-mannosyl-transferase
MAFQDTPSASVSRRSWFATLRTVAPVPAGAAAGLAVLLYASSLDNPFVYDDYRLIVENPAIQNLSSVLTVLARDVTRPIVSLSYVADTAVWGTSPFGYHLTNVLLHALNVVLAYWVAFFAADDWRRRNAAGRPEGLQPRTAEDPQLRTRFAPAPAVVATVTSALTAAHPVMTQAVGYVTARSELLYGAFFLAALLAARQWMRAGGAWRLLAIALWVVSLLAKETAAMLPLVLWCYDAWLIDGDRDAYRRRVKGLYAPLLAAVLLLGGARLTLLALEYSGETGPDWRNLLVSVDAFWQYFALFVRPHGQTIMHTVPFVAGFTARIVAAVAGLWVLAAVIWSLRRIQGPISLGLLMAGALLVPGSVLFITGIGEPMAEHRAYVSAMGFFLACGAGAGMAWSRAQAAGRGTLVVATSGIVLLLQLSGQTLVRNQMWGNPVALAQEAVALSPDAWVPRLFLGETLRQNGRCEEAVPAYRAALAMRGGLRDFTRQKLAACLAVTGQVADAKAIWGEHSR